MNIANSGEEAYRYCKSNGLLNCGAHNWAGPQFKKHFAVMWSGLRPGENMRLFFPASFHSGNVDFVAKDGGVACALTNQRLLMGQKAGMKTREKSIQLSMLNNVSISSSMAFGVITITTNSEAMELKISNRIAKQVYDELQDIASRNASVDTGAIAPNLPNASDEVLRLKLLLDEGAISQDEFDLLKRRALNL